MRIGTHRFLFAVTLAALLAPLSTEAQGWLPDRANPRGVRLGDLELHPSVTAEGGYQSNVFFSDDPTGDVLLRLTPAVTISTLGQERRANDAQSNPPTIAFRAGLSGEIFYYVDTFKDPRLAGNADVDLVVLPERIFSLGLALGASRQVRPLAEGSTPGFGRTLFTPSARIMLQTRGGLLRTELGAGTQFELYDESAFDSAQSLQLNGRWLTTWEFLPKTALFEETTVSSQTFNGDGASDANVMRNDGLLLSSRLGVNGAITSTVGATLAVGYAAALFDSYTATGNDPAAGMVIGGNDEDSLLAQAMLRWSPTQQHALELGYTRSLSFAYLGNHMRSDRVTLSGKAMVGGMVLLQPKVSVTWTNYGLDQVAAFNGLSRAEAKREDFRYDFALQGEYRMNSWLAFTGLLSYQILDTDFELPQPASMEEPRNPLNWKNFEGWLGVKAFL